MIRFDTYPAAILNDGLALHCLVQKAFWPMKPSIEDMKPRKT